MPSVERAERLADIAEWYYRDQLTQQQISDRTGITRPTVSRMLTEASRLGIVTFTVNRPLNIDSARGQALRAEYPQLEHATVVATPARSDRLHDLLGRAAAARLRDLLHDRATIGITWGRSLAATAAAMTETTTRHLTIVQLAGAIADTTSGPHLIMKQLGHALNADTIALNAPLVVETHDLANALINDPTNSDAITAGRAVTIALFGIGTTDPHTASLVGTGHLTHGDMAALAHAGAIGEVAGYPITSDGEPVDTDYETRLVAIPRAQLLEIPTRVAIAGGTHKALAIRAAITGGYITNLITDADAADQMLQR